MPKYCLTPINVLNKHLFSGALPDCLITLQCRKRSYGYFCGNRFGREDCKETGDSVHHIVVPGGPFDKVANTLISRSFKITWIEQPRLTPDAAGKTNENVSQTKESKSGKRVKYICPKEECGQTAWAKHDANLMHGDHVTAMEPSA